MHNIDRGIIKWLPFDALSGYKEAIYALKKRRSKLDKPLLSVDQIEQLNYELNVATELKKNITIYCYLKGRIFYQTGFIEDLDYIRKRIKINKTWLDSNNILKLEIN